MSLFAALDAQGVTRYIGEVTRGAACGCFCAECQSPVVAKQGTDHVWHFAHEASQERPQCLPGSINLLRRLAIERLLETHLVALPECSAVVTTDVRYPDINEFVAWTLPAVAIVRIDAQAAFNRPVVWLSPVRMPGCTIGMWVQIGELATVTDEKFDGELVYRCPPPEKGEITTRASAVDYLQTHSRWHWQKLPDVDGALEQAHSRVNDRVAARKAELVSKLQSLRTRLQQRSAGLSWGAPEQEPVPVPAPAWADLKKKNTSFFAFEMTAQGEFWILMEAADHVGYYIVPGAGLADGWDESLPRSLGQADLDKGAYRGEGSIDNAIQAIRNLGVASSRIDSNALSICTFTGWTEDLSRNP